MAIIRVDTEQLARDWRKVADRKERAEKELKKLYDEMLALNGMWQGSANAAMKASFAQDKEYFQDVCSDVQAMIDSLKFAEAEYCRCEQFVDRAIALLNI